jgi:hypothetical protein
MRLQGLRPPSMRELQVEAEAEFEREVAELEQRKQLEAATLLEVEKTRELTQGRRQQRGPHNRRSPSLSIETLYSSQRAYQDASMSTRSSGSAASLRAYAAEAARTVFADVNDTHSVDPNKAPSGADEVVNTADGYATAPAMIDI